jgi:AhpD family alkylhydroperoxidase
MSEEAVTKDYKAYRRLLATRMKSLQKDHPKLMGAFQSLHQASAEPGALDTKTKELMALACAITARCDGCIAFHMADAIKAGATRAEVQESLGVAVLMGGGPALMYALHAQDALDAFAAGSNPA